MMPKSLKHIHTLTMLAFGEFSVCFAFFLGRVYCRSWPGTLYVDQRDHEPTEISLPRPPICWDYNVCTQPWLTLNFLKTCRRGKSILPSHMKQYPWSQISLILQLSVTFNQLRDQKYPS